VTEGSAFAYTLPRLLGLHNLSGAKFALYLDVTTQYVSLLMKGERRPTAARTEQIARIFGIDPDRLASAPFEELLQVEIADPERYRETQKRIAALERAAKARTIRRETARAARPLQS
jgi:transcriptional regulator with XRE-family HTH domain